MPSPENGYLSNTLKMNDCVINWPIFKIFCAESVDVGYNKKYSF